MADCKQCLHYEVCADMAEKFIDAFGRGEELSVVCKNFKDRTKCVEVVRCRDCKHRRGDFFGGFVCRLHKGLAMVTDESFCSYGERRENAGTD